MSMVKIINPAGWNWDRPIAQRVKVSSRGLIGQDRRDFLKVASHQFVELIDSIKVAKDEEPVHLIALGASEAYGPNRNGDGFKEATCRDYHKTFEKFARWYRNHQNKDPDKSYGYIKQSAYNSAMRRVELLTMLNATKEAAARNGGFVADKEIEKLAAGEDIPVSMACRVPYDICSGCDNHARTRDDYCTGDTCKYGGCRDNLTKVAEDGHILHVDNPSPSWFDISNVFRPADRIAYGAKADYLQKAASAQDFLPGAAMADALGVVAPLSVILSQDEPYVWQTKLAGQVKLAYALAELERKGHGLTRETLRGLDSRLAPQYDGGQLSGVLGAPGSEKAASSLSALADRKIILPLSVFAAWLGKEALAKEAADMLPGIYQHLVSNGHLERSLTLNPFATAEKTASATARVFASNTTPGWSLSTDALRDRAMKSSIRGYTAPEAKSACWNEKRANDNRDAAELAESYSLYKLAALHRIAGFDQQFSLTARLAVAQNSCL